MQEIESALVEELKSDDVNVVLRAVRSLRNARLLSTADSLISIVEKNQDIATYTAAVQALSAICQQSASVNVSDLAAGGCWWLLVAGGG